MTPPRTPVDLERTMLTLTPRLSVSSGLASLMVYGAAAMVCLTAVWGCGGSNAEIKALSRRVDSLDLAIQVMKKAGGAPRPKGPDTATVMIDGAYGIGRLDAPVVIVEFTDFQCPWCGQHFRTTLPRLMADYVDKGVVRYVVRNLPLPIHPAALTAAKAARCAEEVSPGSFWSVHNALFQAQPRLADSTVTSIVRGAGVKPRGLEACIKAPKTALTIENEAKVARDIGIVATPGFIIGPNNVTGRISGRAFTGAYPFEEFQKAIAAALAKTQRS